MRSRLLTPFVSALAGSLFVLLAMFVWSGMRQPGEQLLLLEPTVAEANTVGITLTLTSSAPTTLGTPTAFVATVAITPSTQFSVTLNYNINGSGSVSTTGVFTQPQPLTFTHFYTAPGIYTATATVFVTGTATVTSSIPITVNGPSISLTSTLTNPSSALLGDTAEFTITITNFTTQTVQLVQLEYGGLVTPTDVFTTFPSPSSGGTIVLTGTKPVTFTQPGTFTPTASIVTTGTYDIERSSTLTITVKEPKLTLSANPTSVVSGNNVTFTATPSDISTKTLTLTPVTFNFGDGNQGSDTTAPFTVTHTYTDTGIFTATATLSYTGSVSGSITSNSVTITVTAPPPPPPPVTPTLTLVGPTTPLKAGQNLTGEESKGVVTATLSPAPAVATPISFTITTNTGAVVTPTSGLTDDSGIVTATVTAGKVGGPIVVVATSGALSATTTISSVLDANTAVESIRLEPGTPTVEVSLNLTIPGVGSRPFFLTLSGNITQPTDLLLSMRALPISGTVTPSAPITPTTPTTPTTMTQNLFLAQVDDEVKVPAQTSSGEITMYGFNVEVYRIGDATPLTTAELRAFLDSISGTATLSTTYEASDLTQQGVAIVPTTVGLFQLDQSPNVFSKMTGSTSNPTTRVAFATVTQTGLHILAGRDRQNSFLPIVIRN